MKKIFILLIGICILTTGCMGVNTKEEEVKTKVEGPEKISYAKVNDIINNYNDYVDVEVIDVREASDYNEGHLMGSINIPYENLEEIFISTEREIIVYDTTALKSKQAAKDLYNMGYTKVKYIAGIEKWPYDLED